MKNGKEEGGGGEKREVGGRDEEEEEEEEKEEEERFKEEEEGKETGGRSRVKKASTQDVASKKRTPLIVPRHLDPPKPCDGTQPTLHQLPHVMVSRRHRRTRHGSRNALHPCSSYPGKTF
ncbi:hypothetical protein E2C01_078776 [Portunus trituberculatus]|uniref:Uncharacterized protein n=1 Tax=Portunus trituberculatus TaxID=210409 RepID=A0A5B7IF85_PORTR|nr:hypothetical protein [Portunus trituberculatus]